MPSIVPEDLNAAGTHALVIGISSYLHLADGDDPTPVGESFNIEQLSSAARSASEFAGWLVREYRHPNKPLKSLRVLLSPSPGEMLDSDVRNLLPDAYAATRAAVERELAGFRNACNAHRENVAMVYIAGHGVQLTKHGSVVLLHDFGAAAHLNQLQGAIDMAGVHAGMNHPNTAQTQFWFVDACRQKPSVARRFETMTGALALDEPTGVAEVSPLFLAATTGRAAYGKPGGVSLFNEALMWALRDGGAAEGPNKDQDNWHVSVTRLIKVLPKKVKELANQYQEEQPVDVAGRVQDAVVHSYDQPPKVDLHIGLSPAAARDVSRGTLARDAQEVIVADFTGWPLARPVDAGLYLLRVDADMPFRGAQAMLDVEPPSFAKELELSQ